MSIYNKEIKNTEFIFSFSNWKLYTVTLSLGQELAQIFSFDGGLGIHLVPQKYLSCVW